MCDGNVRILSASRRILLLVLLLSCPFRASGQDVTASADPPIGQATLTVKFGVSSNITGLSLSGNVCTWSFGDGTNYLGAKVSDTVSHDYKTPGTFTATVWVWNSSVTTPLDPANSASWSWSASTIGIASVTVQVLPDYFWVSAAATPASGNAPLTVGFTSTIKAGGFAPFTYAWNFGDIFQGTSTAANPTYTYSMPGIYSARVVVTDSKGWQSTGMVTVFASMSGLAVNASAAPTQGFAPLGVGFVASASGGTGPYTYTWNFGDGTTGTGASTGHTYAAPGTYTAMVTATDSKGRWTMAGATAVNVYPLMVMPPMP